MNEKPQVGIFWMIKTVSGENILLSSGCDLEKADPYGDFLTFDASHYDTWEHWRKSSELSSEAKEIVIGYEYEDWPRGRIVYDQIKSQFTLYADRRLMSPFTITSICERFHLPKDRVTVKGDFHYQSKMRL